MCNPKVDDIVKAHIQVQPRTETEVVGKLSYCAKGLFIITWDVGGNSFEVRRYAPKSSTRKYKNTELYLLPPALFSSEVLDTMNQRYLDSKNALIVSPLLKPMHIELYNDTWLQPRHASIPTKSRIKDLPQN